MRAIVNNDNFDEQLIVTISGRGWSWHAGDVVWDERKHGLLPQDLSGLGGYERTESPSPNNPKKLIYTLSVDNSAKSRRLAAQETRETKKEQEKVERISRRALINGLKSANTVNDLKQVLIALVKEIGLGD